MCVTNVSLEVNVFVLVQCWSVLCGDDECVLVIAVVWRRHGESVSSVEEKRRRLLCVQLSCLIQQEWLKLHYREILTLTAPAMTFFCQLCCIIDIMFNSVRAIIYHFGNKYIILPFVIQFGVCIEVLIQLSIYVTNACRYLMDRESVSSVILQYECDISCTIWLLIHGSTVRDELFAERIIIICEIVIVMIHFANTTNNNINNNNKLYYCYIAIIINNTQIITFYYYLY